MTIKERILHMLANSPMTSFSNREISGVLGVPEPSVRRETKSLFDTGKIKRAANGKYQHVIPEPKSKKKPVSSDLRQYVAIVTDHSASMRGLQHSAAKDYNNVINTIREQALEHDIDTSVTHILCGDGHDAAGNGRVTTNFINEPVNALQEMSAHGSHGYRTDGWSTPLYDSVGRAIELFQEVHDKNEHNVSFLLLIITDGLENSSRIWKGLKLSKEIKDLQGTDRWTFTFRVPRDGSYHYAQNLANALNIPIGNILEWETTERGLDVSSHKIQASIGNYFAGRTKGVRSSSTFYANLGHVNATQIRSQMADITGEVDAWDISKYSNGSEIRTYVEQRGYNYTPGCAFYQLTKSEKVQPYKKILVEDRTSRKYYAGDAARKLLGVYVQGDIRLRPGDHGQYNIFIQSTSVNRKLVGDTKLVYWPSATRY